MISSSTVQMILLLIATFGNILVTSKFFAQSWKVSLFIIANIYILILYIFALIHKLDYGVNFIIIAGNIFFLERIIKRANKEIKISKFNEILWLIPFLIFIKSVSKDYKFTMFDELNHWAVNIKFLVAERTIGDLHSSTRLISNGFNQAYPPAQELFQFLIINKLKWSEANVLISQIILILICLLALNAIFENELTWLSYALFITSIIVFYLFGLRFNNILADNFLAVHFATCLALSLKIVLNKRNILFSGICLAVLVLIKPVSFIFTILPLAIFSIRLLTANREINAATKDRSKAIVGAKNFRLNLITIYIFPLLAYFSWAFHIKQLNISTKSVTHNFFDQNSQSNLLQILNTYKDTFFGAIYGIDNLAGTSSSVPKIVEILHVSLFSIILILTICQIFLLLLKPKQARKEFLLITLAVILFAILYQVTLLFLYFYFFGEVAALMRYTVPFLYGWAMLVFHLFIDEISHFKNRSIIFIALFLTIFFNLPTSLSNDAIKINSNPIKVEKRLSVEKLAKQTRIIAKQNEKAYYIYQDSDNFEKYIFSYSVLPIASNEKCSSIGEPYSDKDLWTCSINLEAALKGYSYLVVGKADNKFWSLNSIYLSPKSEAYLNGIYRISYSGSKLLLLNIYHN